MNCIVNCLAVSISVLATVGCGNFYFFDASRKTLLGDEYAHLMGVPSNKVVVSNIVHENGRVSFDASTPKGNYNCYGQWGSGWLDMAWFKPERCTLTAARTG